MPGSMSSAVEERGEQVALVVTSIAAPNRVLRELARGCASRRHQFIVIGDEASPPDFRLDGCQFYGLEAQGETGFAFARLCPTRHYARKNLGYLLAIRSGAEVIVETDDDNVPREEFWRQRQRHHRVSRVSEAGWINAYRYFSDALIWPRGLPLDVAAAEIPDFDTLPVDDVDCPIQQGLVDDNPDVDAIYRLILPLPQRFRRDRRLALASGSWCPFNSQNTSWWPDAYPLLYLPAYCSFRMTDIWRSFVAQRIAWTNGWSVLFHEPTMEQDRNEHDLLRDFADELPGYLHNRRIGQALEGLSLRPGVDNIGENMRVCYGSLVAMSIVDKRELDVLGAWLNDFKRAHPFPKTAPSQMQ